MQTNYELAIESAQVPFLDDLLTTEDGQLFSSVNAPWSDAEGSEAVIKVSGVLTGAAVSVSATANQVSVSAGTARLPWVAGADEYGDIAVEANAALVITRGSGDDTHIVNAVVINASGDYAIVAGSPHTAHVTDRGEPGGPPYVPVDEILVAELYLTTIASAVVLPAEIRQAPGINRELSYLPVYQTHLATGEINFAAQLQMIHAGDTPRYVHVSGAVPLFAAIPWITDWQPAESTYSVDSTMTFDGPLGSSTQSMGEASFNALFRNATDRLTAPLNALVGQNLWFRYKPSKNKTYPYQLTQGRLSLSGAIPAEGEITVACTIAPQERSLTIQGA